MQGRETEEGRGRWTEPGFKISNRFFTRTLKLDFCQNPSPFLRLQQKKMEFKPRSHKSQLRTTTVKLFPFFEGESQFLNNALSKQYISTAPHLDIRPFPICQHFQPAIVTGLQPDCQMHRMVAWGYLYGRPKIQPGIKTEHFNFFSLHPNLRFPFAKWTLGNRHSFWQSKTLTNDKLYWQ